MRERVAVGAALALVVIALGIVLTNRAPRLASTNTRVAASAVALPVAPGQERCQAHEFVPRSAHSVRVFAAGGGPFALAVRGLGTDLTSRALAPVRRAAVALSLGPRSRDLSDATVCVRNLGAHPLSFAGNLTPQDRLAGPTATNRGVYGDVVRLDFFRAGRESWLDLLPAIIGRLWLFKSPFHGPATFWAALVLVAGALAAALALVFRRGANGGGVPVALWVCAALAVANGTAWALVTPPLQVPDELAHYGYTQYLAETGRIPRPRAGPYSQEEIALIDAVRFSTQGRPSWSRADDSGLRRRLSGRLGRKAEGGASNAVNNPPLYYALEAVPYRLADSSSYLDRLFLMRLLSALLAGVTVACVFLFLRELLPAAPWSWTVGALAVAFQPMFGFVSGGVNNDNLLYAAAAALFFLVARAFRRGLTPRLGAAIGVVAVAGMLTKQTIYGVLPGAAAGLVLLAWRAEPEQRRQALWGLALAFGCALVPYGVWIRLNDTQLERAGTTTSGLTSPSPGHPVTLSGQISYLWHFFTPRLQWIKHALGFSAHRLPYPAYPLWDVYYQGFVGRFGQFQFGFPLWVSQLALALHAAVVGLAGAALIRAREVLRRRWAEVLTYSLMAAGLVVLVGLAGYRYRQHTSSLFEQARYLLPLLALYGALVALAVRGAGARWGRAVGGVVVVAAMAHSLFAMLITVARYYA